MRILRNIVASSARRHSRIGLSLLVGALMIVGTGDEAIAKHGKRHLHARHFVANGCRRESAERVQLVSQQPVHLGPMRYYGGPKSPMWRGPVEN